MLFEHKPDQPLHGLEKHLSQLLNTRKGALSYLPDYGLVDLNEIYQQLPASMGLLVSEVKNLISRYEPRLTNVSIVPYLSDAVDCVVYLKLHARVEGAETPVHFETYFLSGGEAKIQWMT